MQENFVLVQKGFRVLVGSMSGYIGQEMSRKYTNVLRTSFQSMDLAQNILVVKTVAGMAMAVAAALDAMHMKEIVGTIAGDDTIMMAIRTVDDTIQVMDKIKEMIE